MFAANAFLTNANTPLAANSVAAYVSTQETTTSTSYTNLTTTTDTVTVDVPASGIVLVSIFSDIYNSQATAPYSRAYVSFDISGKTTKAPDDTRCITYQSYGNSNGNSVGNGALGATFLETGLNAGSTTFKMKYRVAGGTGYFATRRICVIPMGG